jgi:hypothetical protein
MRFKPPYPKPLEAHPKPNGVTSRPTPRCGGRIWAFPRGPEDLLLDEPTARRSASTRPSPGRRRLAHGHDAHGHLQRRGAAALRIDVLFLYMANMAWNSSMNTGAPSRC